jgi:hypothetical protein
MGMTIMPNLVHRLSEFPVKRRFIIAILIFYALQEEVYTKILL